MVIEKSALVHHVGRGRAGLRDEPAANDRSKKAHAANRSESSLLIAELTRGSHWIPWDIQLVGNGGNPS